MIIPCVACQTKFQLNKNAIKVTGSMVRCSKCHNIFTVYPLDDTTESAPRRDEIMKEPKNIDQKFSDKNEIKATMIKNSAPKDRKEIAAPPSMLDNLLGLENVPKLGDIPKSGPIIEEAVKESDNFMIDKIMSIEDFEEEEFDTDTEDIEYADLPDLSELEGMINWDDIVDSEESPTSDQH